MLRDLLYDVLRDYHLVLMFETVPVDWLARVGVQSVALEACAWAVSGSTHGIPDAKGLPTLTCVLRTMIFSTHKKALPVAVQAAAERTESVPMGEDSTNDCDKKCRKEERARRQRARARACELPLLS